MSVLAVSVVHFRRRAGHEGDGEPIHGHAGLEILWTAIPVTGAAIYSGVVLADIEKEKPATRAISVTAQQFAWTFDYKGLGVKRAGELHLVEGKGYILRIRSLDVIDSFWVPEFRLKKDAVPGGTTEFRVTPSRAGSHAGVCAELCGLGHATMRARVVVEDQRSFDRWAEDERKVHLGLEVHVVRAFGRGVPLGRLGGMDMGSGMIVVMVVMMTAMLGLVGGGMWAARRRRSSQARVDSSEEDSAPREG